MKKKLVVLLCLISLVMLASCSLDRLLYGDAPSDFVIERFFSTGNDNKYKEGDWSKTKIDINESYIALGPQISGYSNYTGVLAGGVKMEYVGGVEFGVEDYTYTLTNNSNTLIIKGTIQSRSQYSSYVKYTYNGNDLVSLNELSRIDEVMYRAANNITINNLSNYASFSGKSVMKTLTGDTITRTVTLNGTSYTGVLSYSGSYEYKLEIQGITNSYGTLSNYQIFKLNDKPLNEEQLNSHRFNINSVIDNDAFVGL